MADNDDNEEGSLQGLWWLGVVIACFAQLAGVVGNQLVKTAHRARAAIPEDERPPAYTYPTWVMGMVCITLLNTVLHIASYAFAPQSTLAALGCLSLVWSLGVAWFFQGDQPTRWDAVGTGISVVGVTVATVFASHTTRDYDVHDLMELYTRTLFLIYAAGGVAFFVFMFLASRRKEVPFRRLAMASLAGIVAGATALTSKSAVELIKSASKGDDDFEHPFAYVIIVAAIAFAVIQIKLHNRTLRHYDPIVIVPIYGAFMLLSRASAGLVYFEEHKDLSKTSRYMFPIGLAITFAALTLFVRHPDVDEYSDDEDDDDDDTTGTESATTDTSPSSTVIRSSVSLPGSSSSSSNSTDTETAMAERTACTTASSDGHGDTSVDDQDDESTVTATATATATADDTGHAVSLSSLSSMSSFASSAV